MDFKISGYLHGILIVMNFSTVTTAITLQVGWLAPRNSTTGKTYPYNVTSSMSALAYAIEKVQNESVLRDYIIKGGKCKKVRLFCDSLRSHYSEMQGTKGTPYLGFVKTPLLRDGRNKSVTWIDSGCNLKQSLGALTDVLLMMNLDVIFGPPCSEGVQSVSELMSYRNTTIINWVSTGQTTESRFNMDTYIQLMPPISSLGGVLSIYFFYTKWRRLVLISTEGQMYDTLAVSMFNSFRDLSKSGFLIVHHYSGLKDVSDTATIDMILNTIKYEGRIILLVSPQSELRRYMLRAHALGMTDGDYQFIYASANFASAAEISVIESDALWKMNDGQDDIARQAFKNVLFFISDALFKLEASNLMILYINISMTPLQQTNVIMTIMKFGEEMHLEEYYIIVRKTALHHTVYDISSWSTEALQSAERVFGNHTSLPKAGTPDEYAGYLYDAFLLYAMAANVSLSKNRTIKGSDIYSEAPYILFTGLTGDVVLNVVGDRFPAFFVYDLNSNGIFHWVASLSYYIKNGSYDTHPSFRTITWGDGRTSDNYMPPDTPPCGFFNEYCPPATSFHDENTQKVIIAVVCVTMLVAFLIMYIIFRWMRWEKNLRSMNWKIAYEDLNFNSTKRTKSFSSVSGKLLRRAGSLHKDKEKYSEYRNRSGSIGNISLNRGQLFTTVAFLNGDTVAVKRIKKKKVATDRKLLLEMKTMTKLKHANLTTLIGICTDPGNVCVVWEYCQKGSIQDVIENKNIKLETMFKLSIAIDISKGLEYIHNNDIKFHGNLKSSNCVIDSRWVCKLTDFGLTYLKTGEQTDLEIGDHEKFTRLFWTAPEQLRRILSDDPARGSAAGDIYSFGIILKELVCRSEPFATENLILTPKEMVYWVAYPVDNQIFRPSITDMEYENREQRAPLCDLIQDCWQEDPNDRPNIRAVIRALNTINPFKKSSVVDNMIVMMEKYSNNLEELVAERTEQLAEEKRKTDQLLYRMLPKKVADELKLGKPVQAEAFDSVTIYFSDIVEFTTIASESTPMEIVALLNELYTVFDDIIEKFDVYKVETIGDAYMIVSGLPERNGNLHVQEIARVSLNILKAVQHFVIPHKPDRKLQIRIGIHTGPVVTGVVGLTMPRYCLFGDTVNTASRMESNGKALSIHISSATREALREFPQFRTDERGEIQVKGKGTMTTHWLIGENLEELERKAYEADVESSDEHHPVGEEVETGEESRRNYAILRRKECSYSLPETQSNEVSKNSALSSETSESLNLFRNGTSQPSRQYSVIRRRRNSNPENQQKQTQTRTSLQRTDNNINYFDTKSDQKYLQGNVHHGSRENDDSNIMTDSDATPESFNVGSGNEDERETVSIKGNERVSIIFDSRAGSRSTKLYRTETFHISLTQPTHSTERGEENV